MATFKKQRQRMTMKIKRMFKCDIASARKVARIVVDQHLVTNVTSDSVSELLGVTPDFNPGCKCCGNSTISWIGKNGSIVAQWGLLKVVELT
ncbi:MAG: hypothetical protein RL621_343 [Bacteroidota bacterium]|jgi:hypothetical protein